MEYRKLGSTDLKLSTITHGAWAIGGAMWGGNEKKDSIASIHASLDHGVTSIDTAPFYGLGASEELVGEAIKGRDRSKIQILTKFGMLWDGSNKGRGEFWFDTEEGGKKYPVYKYAGAANVVKEAEDCLRRLGTDYIDLFQLHWPDATTPIAETMEALEKLIQQGKIRAAGVCNYSAQQMREAVHALPKLASDQVPYSMLGREIEHDLVPWSLENGTGIIAYSPMARGLLTGKYFKDSRLKQGDHRAEYFSKFNLENVKMFLDAITPLAESKRATLSQLVLRWTTLQRGITIVLAGARNAEQAIENAAAMAVDLTAADLQLIEKELSKI